MPLPANLTDKIRRWDYQSSAREEGFRADTATIEYASIDLATFEAVAEAINTATIAGDPVVILVNVDGQDVELFRGVVGDWRLEERGGQGLRETVGVLEAQDERGRLLRTAAPETLVFRGPLLTLISGTGPGFPIIAYGRAFSEMFSEMARIGGVTISGPLPRDYAFHQQIAVAGLSVGSAMSEILKPLQEFRGLRNDFIRRGQIYQVRERTIPLGTADLSIPGSLVKVRSYRRTFPQDPRQDLTEITPAIEFDGGLAGVGFSDANNVTRCYDTPDGGSICQEFFLGRITGEEITKRLIAGDGSTHTVVDRIDYEYAGFLHRLDGRIATTTVDGIVEKRDETAYYYSPDDKIAAEYTRRFARNRQGTLQLVAVTTLDKAETDAGAVKTMTHDRVTQTDVIPEDRAFEFSPGDLDSAVEIGRPPSDRIIRPADEIDPLPLLGRSLIEVGLEVPLDTRISSGTIVDLTAPVTVTAATRFYIVGVQASWAKGQGHTMRIDGEAWI